MKRGMIRAVLLAGIIIGGVIVGTRWTTLFPDRPPEGADEPVDIDIESDPRLLIQRSLDAYGGFDRIEQIRALQLESTVTLYRVNPDPLHGQSVEYFQFPDRVRTDMTIGNRKNTHIYDGLHAWTIEGKRRIRDADYVAESLRMSIKNIPILLLQEALDERSILEPIELDKLDGRLMFVLPLNDSDGAQIWLWFDSESYLLGRLDYTSISSRGPSAIQVRMEDYREFDGIQTAALITFTRNGVVSQETHVEKAAYNPELPDSLFTMPNREE